MVFNTGSVIFVMKSDIENSFFSKKFLPLKNISAKEINKDLVVIENHTGNYHIFNSTGATVWHALGEGRQVFEIVEHLVQRFEIDPDCARNDIEIFIGEMKKKGLIKEHIT